MPQAFTGPIDLSNSPHATLRPVSQSAVQLADGLWKERRQAIRRFGLRHGHAMLVKSGNIENLRWAAGKASGPYRGPLFMDSDLYKWIEAVSLELANEPDNELLALMDSVIDVIASAQTPEGYLNSYFQMVEPQNRWKNLAHGHELYCAGHLFQAAVAHVRTTGSHRLLEVATKFADHIDSLFCPGGIESACGHPEIETALVELARATGEKRYLRLAQFFLDQRGHGRVSNSKSGATLGNSYLGSYLQDHVPVRDAKEVTGHAVRQLYLTAGMADVHLETGEKALLDAQIRQWRDMTSCKSFITGGIGSRPSHEAFGPAYDLPNAECYCETCAQIASVFWNFRLLLITGESRFADVIERTLFNSCLSGVSLDGSRYFYVNVLASNGGIERPEWHGCACCPPNVMRLLASIGQYFATHGEAGVQVHQFSACRWTTPTPAGEAVLNMATRYPWQGDVAIEVERIAGGAPWELAVRVPEWAEDVSFTLNGKAVAAGVRGGYARFHRAWQAGDKLVMSLRLTPRLSIAHPHVDACVGRVAIEHGPLVYCVEQPDHEASILDLRLDASAPLDVVWRDDLLGGTLVVEANAYVADREAWGDRLYLGIDDQPLPATTTTLQAIPYFLWANRGAHAMRVWLPVARRV